MGFSNRFSWSLSREGMFDECTRRYYYHYYLSWGGWKTNAPRVVREAFKLKRLVSLSLWRGQLVHYVTSKVLQSMKVKGRIPRKEDVIGYILERFQKQVDFSKARRYLTEPKRKGKKLNIDWLALLEHEYNRELDADRIERARQECIQGIEGLFKSPILSSIGETDPGGWFIEDLDHAEFSQSFQFQGVTVYVKTDLMFRGRDGTFNIVDWKTYRAMEPGDRNQPFSRDAQVQLGIYSYYAVQVLQESLDLIRLYEVNLLEGGKVIEYNANKESIEAFTGHIKTGISKLAATLRDGDTERNEPLPPRSFSKIDNGRCRFCNFYRICKDENYPDKLSE